MEKAIERALVERMFVEFANEYMPEKTPERAAMQRLSEILGEQMDAGAVEGDTVGSYELAAMRYGFYEGFRAALKLLQEQGAA